MYESGHGTSEDYAPARYWLELATHYTDDIELLEAIGEELALSVLQRAYKIKSYLYYSARFWKMTQKTMIPIVRQLLAILFMAMCCFYKEKPLS